MTFELYFPDDFSFFIPQPVPKYVLAASVHIKYHEREAVIMSEREREGEGCRKRAKGIN